MQLNQEHLNEWCQGSGIQKEFVLANVRSLNSRSEIHAVLAFNPKSHSGWFVSGIDPQSNEPRTYGQFKSDIEVKLEGKVAKYISPKGSKSQGIFLRHPAQPDFWPNVLSSHCPIYITEGAKKAAALLQHDKAAIAVTGVWNALVDRKYLIKDLLLFAKPDRLVYICFDSDQISNSNVQIAIKCLKAAFVRHNCNVVNIVLPSETKGIDDFLLVKSISDFEALCSACNQHSKIAANNAALDKSEKVSVPEPLMVAKLLAVDWKKQVLFELASNEWYIYAYQQDGIWTCVSALKVQHRIICFLDSHYKGASYSFSFITNVMNFLKPLLMLDEVIPPEFTIPFRNGLFFLQTKSLVAFKPEFFCTFTLPCDYDAEALCCKIDHFLNQCVAPHHDMVELLYAIFGLALTRNSSYQLFFEIVGPGGSGKSSLINLLIAILGKNNVLVTDLHTLEHSRFESASLKGKCAVVITEGERFSEKSSMLKRIVGGDLLRYERKYEQPGEGFYCRAIVLIASNELIVHSDSSSGLFRRRVLIPFNNKVAASHRRDLLSFSYDGTIQGDFVSELPGFVNKIIQKLEPSNFAKLDTVLRNPLLLSGSSQSVLASISDNSVFSFIKEWIIFNPIFMTQLGAKNTRGTVDLTSDILNLDEGLYRRYCEFCESQNIHAMALNRFSNSFLDICTNQLNLSFVSRLRKTSGIFYKGVLAFDYAGPFTYNPVADPELPSPLLQKTIISPKRSINTRLPLNMPIEVFRIKREEI